MKKSVAVWGGSPRIVAGVEAVENNVSGAPLAPGARHEAGAGINRTISLWLLCLLLVVVAAPGFAGPLESVPEPLRPWVSWVLHDVDDHGCPPQYNSAEDKRCVWAGRLELQLGGAGGTFRQTAKAYRKTWFALPGDARRWPQNVTLDGAAAAVVSRNDQPGIWLPAGEHTLAGAFVWQELPDKLTLARETALIALSIKGQTVASPFIDESGLLWLARTAVRTASGPVDMRVFRLVEDGVPVIITTRLLLDASENEEAVYGPALPEGATPIALNSALPARIEPDGSLRVQLRPGQWEITLVARLPSPVTELARAQPRGAWPKEEIWSYAAQPQLRLATPSGPDAVDPQQTAVPQEWKAFPAFRMRQEDRLAFAETRRGDPQPEPDKLRLARRIWLDFDGSGYTVQDTVSGALSRTWRMEMEAPFELGRAALDGADRLITRLRPDAPAGIELRRGSIALTADSRVESKLRTLPVTGWHQDMQQVSAELNLPPGWRLLAASGVDRAQDSWVAKWTLLDFFLVLIGALAARQLWGNRWAVLILLMFALTWHEPAAPRWVWLGLFAVTALLRELPEGKLTMAARWSRHALFIALAIFALPFAVGQIRQAIYPVLEHPYEQMLAGNVPVFAAEAPAPAPVQERMREEFADEAEDKPELDSQGILAKKKFAISSFAKPESRLDMNKNLAAALYDYDPKAIVQTGPGLPRWHWQSYELQWSGPVERSQTMTLRLTSPAVNALLNLVRVVLVILAALCLAGLRLPRLRLPRGGAHVLLAIFVSALALSPLDSRAEAPVVPDEAGAVKIDSRLLEELKARLTAEQDCHPGCAELSRMMIDAAGASLTLRLAVGAVIDTAIPIPGRRDQWQPRQAMLDGKPAVMVRDTQGVSWLLVPKGAHQIVLEGPLADSQQLSLPMKPRLVTVHAAGHRVEGIDAEGVPADALRIATLTAHAGVKDLAQGQIPSFVRIERSFTLGLHWEIVTRVVRVSADTSPVSIELPLLPGETVVSETVRAAKGQVQAVLPAQAEMMEWRSTLAERSEFALTSGKQTGWVEVWRFDTGALWHAEFEGLAPVHHQSEGRWMPEWRPWPGETLKAKITRPEGVAGRALTIDDSTLELSPGLRSTDTKLALTLRSSRGGEHTITLPEGAQLLGVSINGASQPLRLDARSLRLPVVPGAQLVELSWREPRGMDVLLHTPEVKLNAPSVNATVQVHLPLERWVLWVSGPRAGPAILFWGVLLALIPISFALARVRLAPLAARDWFLLGLGLTQSPVGASIVIVAWFFGLALREKRANVLSNRVHNLLQIALAVLTVTALALLVSAVSNSLLGTPEMQIIGNGSSSMLLNWYQDRSSDALPIAQVLSVPLLVYRLAMLAWALWLAMKLIGWLKWGWRCFAAGGYWRRTVLAKAA